MRSTSRSSREVSRGTRTHVHAHTHTHTRTQRQAERRRKERQDLHTQGHIRQPCTRAPMQNTYRADGKRIISDRSDQTHGRTTKADGQQSRRGWCIGAGAGEWRHRGGRCRRYRPAVAHDIR
jgi:hypothetical protein